jgi:peptidyl-prolyl cis-trans isomerase SurA
MRRHDGHGPATGGDEREDTCPAKERDKERDKVRSATSYQLGAKVSGAMLAGALMLGLASGASSQDIVEVIDGQPITTLDVEHRTKFLQMSNKKKPPEQKEVIDSLIGEIRQIAEAQRHGVEISDEEVDHAYEQVAIRMGTDQTKLTQILVAGGAGEDTLKRRLRAQIALNKLDRAKNQSPERSETK